MYTSILVPIDGSESSDYGLVHAINLAREHRATLHIVHAVDSYPLLVEMSSNENFERVHEDLRQYGQGLLDRARLSTVDSGVTAETHLREIVVGRAADLIVDEARRMACDLIVMGTHGRRGFRRLVLGSNAESVVRSSAVPVLLVPHGPG